MSNQQVERFWSEVFGDPAIAAKLEAGDTSSTVEAIVAMAERSTVTVTREQIAAAVARRLGLADAELEAVVGGAGTSLGTTPGGPSGAPDQTIGGFKSVSGLDSENEAIEYRQGSEPSPLRRP
jgi:predicted ribosomally synthesized peptide with nif11-like leader